MIPVGYMFKKVTLRPDWLQCASVADIYSVSSCISEDFTDYIELWLHNGYWLFDSPITMEQITARSAIDLSEMTLFYYTVYETEFDRRTKTWNSFQPEPGAQTSVEQPQDCQIQGYDVVTFVARTNPECSPLSCNGLASKIPVNKHCLIASFEEARLSLEAGMFDDAEPGACRIFAVYTVAR